MMHVRFEKYGSWKWTLNDIFYKKLLASVLGATPHFPHFQVANLVFQCVFFQTFQAYSWVFSAFNGAFLPFFHTTSAGAQILPFLYKVKGIQNDTPTAWEA